MFLQAQIVRCLVICLALLVPLRYLATSSSESLLHTLRSCMPAVELSFSLSSASCAICAWVPHSIFFALFQLDKMEATASSLQFCSPPRPRSADVLACSDDVRPCEHAATLCPSAALTCLPYPTPQSQNPAFPLMWDAGWSVSHQEGPGKVPVQH